MKIKIFNCPENTAQLRNMKSLLIMISLDAIAIFSFVIYPFT